MSFWRKQATGPPDAPVVPEMGPSDGEKAHQQAVENLAAARSRDAEVHRVSQSLLGLRERNHFKPKIEQLFYGGQG